MTLTRSDLWRSIAAMELDAPDASLPFSAKLADAQGWSGSDTERVITEYRRFLYITQIVDVPPTPPEPIDAAWRVHLTYTQSYWTDLEPRLSGPLHRDPDLREDASALRAFYDAASDVYAREFDAAPPPDIWVSPGRLDWGGAVVLLIIGGVAGSFLAMGAAMLWGWLVGAPVGGPVDTPMERAGVVVFLFCWTLAFFSPLWAWLLTRNRPRLATTKRGPKPRWDLSVSFIRSLDAD
ncbi:MAG: hypothetical protein AAGK37_01785 [Pseudomonadota bacterium]